MGMEEEKASRKWEWDERGWRLFPTLRPRRPFASSRDSRSIDRFDASVMGSPVNSPSFPISIAVLLFSIVFLAPNAFAECPRKMAASAESKAEEGGGAQPGFSPPKQFIQTTFVHRNLDDLDRQYSQLLAEKLAELRPRMAREAALSLDNENLDCGRVEGAQWEYRCQEYPLEDAFHFLVVEDSRTGAAVYSLARARNWAAEEDPSDSLLGRLEMALLDALSRHSTHPLTSFASEQAKAHVGFVRQLGTAELEQQIRQNNERLTARSKAKSNEKLPILTRSPFEVRLLNERILRQRKADFQLEESDGAAALLHFQGPELADMIDSEADSVQALFVLFWTENTSLGQHSLQLWARAARKWKEAEGSDEVESKGNGAVVFGAVCCEREVELCRAFGVLPLATGHQLMAFRDGHKLGQQLALGDEQFLLDWVRLLLWGPLIRLDSTEQVDNARRHGILPHFEGPRLALSLGLFSGEQQEEFRHFRRAAALLAGRYHLAYWIDPSLKVSQLSTFRRPMMGMVLEEVPYRGRFDMQSLLHHITHASMPDIIDIGYGFTTDLAVHADPALLLLHSSGPASEKASVNSGSQLRQIFVQIGRQLREGMVQFSQLEVNSTASLPLEGLNMELGLTVEDWPAICALNLREIRCKPAVTREKLEAKEVLEAVQRFVWDEQETQEEAAIWTRQFPHRVHLDLASKPHPLAQLQLEQIHALFGRQYFNLDPEPVAELGKSSKHMHHNFDATLESAASSGCPMMAHLDKLHEEL